MSDQATEQMIHTIKVITFADRHAYTDEPYKNTFSNDEFPKIAATPIIRIPVPKKKLDAMEMPKYLLKMIFRKVYRLAHPKLIIILLRIANTKETAFTSIERIVKNPAATEPKRYVIHIHAIANAHVKDFEII